MRDKQNKKRYEQRQQEILKENNIGFVVLRDIVPIAVSKHSANQTLEIKDCI
jgi:hypothetical protein